MNYYFFLIFLILGFVFLVFTDPVEGLIEIKKYRVINSEKVCGDKMCSKIDEQRAKKGLSSRNIEVCGDRPCHEIVPEEVQTIPKNIHTPLGQYNLGIPLDLISCQNPNHKLILKSTNLRPACIKFETIQKLYDNNWALPKIEQEKIFFELSKHEGEFTSIEELSTPPKLGLNITPDFINGQRHLLFEGFGWHRLHNVEITISNELGQITSIRSQANNAGGLYMPWPVPESLPGGFYHVIANDGKNTLEMDFPITHSNLEK